MPEVIFARRALSDLNAIWHYVAEDNVSAADRLVERIKKRCDLLATNPHSGSSAGDVAEHLRAVSVGSYVIFFVPLDGEEGVRGVRVLHGACDLPAAFRGSLKDT